MKLYTFVVVVVFVASPIVIVFGSVGDRVAWRCAEKSNITHFFRQLCAQQSLARRGGEELFDELTMAPGLIASASDLFSNGISESFTTVGFNSLPTVRVVWFPEY